MTIHNVFEAVADVCVYLHAQGQLALPVGPVTLDVLNQIRVFSLYSTPFVQVARRAVALGY